MASLREYSQPAGQCQVGFHLGTSDSSIIHYVKDYGGSLLRAQLSWNTVEDYTTKALSLPSSATAYLAACGTYGITPIVLAAYGPPSTTLAQLTVATTTAAGNTVIPTVETTGYIDPPNCYLTGPTGSKVTTLGDNLFGCVIDSVGTNTITLSSATNVSLTSGTKLTVQRRQYPAIGTDSLSEAGTVAYVAYCTYLANQIVAAGLTGYVEVWNEPPWADDFFNERALYYDTPGSLSGNNRLCTIFCEALLAGSPIAGVTFLNGGSDTTATGSLISKGALTSPAQLSVFFGDSIHPYGGNPETHSWYGTGGCTVANLDPIWSTSNFNGIASQACTFKVANNVGPGIAATECGTNYAGTGKAANNARYLRRRVASLWADGVSKVTLFDLSINSGDGYDIISNGAGAIALPTLTAKLAEIGVGGTAAILPTVSTTPGSWDVMHLGLYGANGALTLLWQRTSDATNWNTMSRPSPVNATVTLPVGHEFKEAIDLETGLQVSLTDNVFPVTDDILLIRTGLPVNTPSILAQSNADLEGGVIVQASTANGVLSIICVNHKYRLERTTTLTISLPPSANLDAPAGYYLIDSTHSNYYDNPVGDGTLQAVRVPEIVNGQVTITMQPRSVHLLQFGAPSNPPPPPEPNFFYQAVPKLFAGPQKPLGLGPDPTMTGY